MAIGKRTMRQGELWIPTQELPTPASHPFYTKINEILMKHGFETLLSSIFGKGTPRGFGDMLARLRKAFLSLFDLHATVSGESDNWGWGYFVEALLQGFFRTFTMGVQIMDFEENFVTIRQLNSAPYK